MPLQGAMMIGVEPDDREGRDAGLRIPAPRSRGRTASSMSRPRPASAEAAFRFEARPSTRRWTATTRSSRSSIPSSNFRSGSPIAAPRKAGCTRRSRARSAGGAQGHRIRCAGSTANRASSSRVERAMPPPSALENLRSCSRRARTGALLRFSLGNEHLKAGDAPRAAEHLARAVALDPDFTAAWKLYGKALAAAGARRRSACGLQRRHRGRRQAGRQAGGEGDAGVRAAAAKQRGRST